MRYLVGLSIVLALSFPVRAEANVLIFGTWTGKCVRPGHPDNMVDLEISRDGIIQFFHKPTTNNVVDYPRAEFTTAAGTSGTLLRFVGSAQNDGKLIIGKITDPNGISINCTLNETS